MVPTNAEVKVSVYGPVKGNSVPSKDAKSTGTQIDYAYLYHVAIQPSRPTSAGCPVTSSLDEMKAFAALNDAALDSGGESVSIWY